MNFNYINTNRLPALQYLIAFLHQNESKIVVRFVLLNDVEIENFNLPFQGPAIIALNPRRDKIIEKKFNIVLGIKTIEPLPVRTILDEETGKIAIDPGGMIMVNWAPTPVMTSLPDLTCATLRQS